jgi:hypothetical protein
MDMMTAGFVSIAITTVSVSVLVEVIGAVARLRLRRRTALPRARPQHRRHAPRVAGILYSGRRIHPEYLPALVRARIFRAQVHRVAVAMARRRRFGVGRAVRI